MAGVLDYSRYIDLLYTVKDIQEHFPLEQLTLTYSFDGQGTQGWTGQMSWQTLIIDRMTYRFGEPNFDNSQVVGYFPGGSKTFVVAGQLQLPAYMYTGPIVPESLENVPITVVEFEFTKGTDIFSKQLLLIENWHPGITLGKPQNDANFTAIEGDLYRLGAKINLSNQTVVPNSTLTINVTATNLTSPGIDLTTVNNPATITITAQGTNTGEIQNPLTQETNFNAGVFNINLPITNQYVPQTLSGNNYQITTGTISTSTFNFTAQVQKSYRVQVSWQSSNIGTEFRSGGTTSTVFVVSTTQNYSTNLIPISVDVQYPSINAITNTAFSFEDIKIRARANLSNLYQGQTNQVKFYADYVQNFQNQYYIFPNIQTTSTNYYVRQIDEIEYTKGLNNPYFDGAYNFNKIKFKIGGAAISDLALVGSKFTLPGSSNNLYTITFGPDTNNLYTISPSYQISHPVSKPQWQLDNDTYNHFIQNQINKNITFEYNPIIYNQATLIGCYGENILIFDNIPDNLKIGATFLFSISGGQQQGYEITAIDAFRNTVTAIKYFDAGRSSYEFIGISTTFVNPIVSPSSIFLGTATLLIQNGSEFIWSLDRKLPEGTYEIRATIDNPAVSIGLGANTVFARNSVENYTMTSSDGINAGISMVLNDSNPTKDIVVVTSNVNTAKNANNFYVFPRPVTFTQNNIVLSTSTWVRQGTSFIQTATLVVNKGVLQPNLIASWPGSLDYQKTSADQILFLPESVSFTPPSSSTVFVSSVQQGATLTLNGEVRILGNPYPFQNAIPGGTQTFRLLGYDKNWASTSSPYVRNSETVMLGTSTMNAGVASLSISTDNFITDFGLSRYYLAQSNYSGDAFRTASVGTSSSIIQVLPSQNYITVKPVLYQGGSPPYSVTLNLGSITIPEELQDEYLSRSITRNLSARFDIEYWIEPANDWPDATTVNMNDLNVQIQMRNIYFRPSAARDFNDSLIVMPWNDLSGQQIVRNKTLEYNIITDYTQGIPILKRKLEVKQYWFGSSQQAAWNGWSDFIYSPSGNQFDSLWFRRSDLTARIFWPSGPFDQWLYKFFNFTWRIKSIEWKRETLQP